MTMSDTIDERFGSGLVDFRRADILANIFLSNLPAFDN
jgi:hypothetical protein